MGILQKSSGLRMECFPKLPGERAFDEMPAPENRISKSGVELLVHAPSGDSGLLANVVVRPAMVQLTWCAE